MTYVELSKEVVKLSTSHDTVRRGNVITHVFCAGGRAHEYYIATVRVASSFDSILCAKHCRLGGRIQG
jgi:hypothetical protein